MILGTEPETPLSNQTRQLDAFIADCRSALDMVAGLEFPIMSILTALASAPSSEIVWTPQGNGLVNGAGAYTTLRHIVLAESVDLLSVRRLGDGAIAVTLSKQGLAVVRQLERLL